MIEEYAQVLFMLILVVLVEQTEKWNTSLADVAWVDYADDRTKLARSTVLSLSSSQSSTSMSC